MFDKFKSQILYKKVEWISSTSKCRLQAQHLFISWKFWSITIDSEKDTYLVYRSRSLVQKDCTLTFIIYSLYLINVKHWLIHFHKVKMRNICAAIISKFDHKLLVWGMHQSILVPLCRLFMLWTSSYRCVSPPVAPSMSESRKSDFVRCCMYELFIKLSPAVAPWFAVEFMLYSYIGLCTSENASENKIQYKITI